MILPFPAFIKSIAASLHLLCGISLDGRKKGTPIRKAVWGNALMFARYSIWRFCSAARFFLHPCFERGVTCAKGWKTCLFSIESGWEVFCNKYIAVRFKHQVFGLGRRENTRSSLLKQGWRVYAEQMQERWEMGCIGRVAGRDSW